MKIIKTIILSLALLSLGITSVFAKEQVSSSGQVQVSGTIKFSGGTRDYPIWIKGVRKDVKCTEKGVCPDIPFRMTVSQFTSTNPLEQTIVQLGSGAAPVCFWYFTYAKINNQDCVTIKSVGDNTVRSTCSAEPTVCGANATVTLYANQKN